MSTIKRRQFLTEPGEQLLLTTDPVAYIRRFDQFLDLFGLAAERVLGTPLSAVPLPVAAKGVDGRPARWAGADPSFMWNPLMWLPPHLALRYRYRVIEDAQGGTNEDVEVESDDVWTIRVALELVHSGLYNPEDGTWLDVLAYYGLDAENPVDQARVELWLRGTPDDILDGIDLTSLVLVADNPEWALKAAADLAGVLVPAEWSLISTGIIETVEAQLDEVGNTDENRRALLNVMGQVAAQALHGVPADPETGQDYIDSIGALVEEAAHPASDSELLMDTFLETLSEVALDYRQSVEALGALDSAATES